MFVQLLAGDAGLDGDVEVLDADAKHGVHPRHVDAYAAIARRHVALQRGAGAERNDRHILGRAEPDDGLHFFRRFREHDDVGRLAWMVGFVMAMLVADGLGRAQPIADDGAKLVDETIVDNRGE